MILETNDTENKFFILKTKRLISRIKRIKRKNKLRNQIPSKKINFSQKNKNLFFINNASPIEIQLKNKLSAFLHFYTNSNETEQVYRNTIENTANEYVSRFFYNKLLGKIRAYQLIDTDRGSNFEFSPDLFTKIVGTSLNVFYVIPIPAVPGLMAGAGQVGLKIHSDKKKINKTKNKLDHCIPENNFVKLLSILLTKTHEADFAHQEKIDLFLEKTFENFWSLFKKQAKENPNREHLNQFWTECLVEYFKELKCPLLQESFYENLNTMVKEIQTGCKPISHDTPQEIIASSVKNSEINLQQQLFIMHFIKALLIQTAMQALIQQEAIKHETPLPSLGYTSARFFNNAPSIQAYMPHYPTPPTLSA